MYKICSKLTIETKKQREWSHPGVSIVNFDHISHIVSGVSIVDFELANAAGKLMSDNASLTNSKKPLFDVLVNGCSGKEEKFPWKFPGMILSFYRAAFF